MIATIPVRVTKYLLPLRSQAKIDAGAIDYTHAVVATMRREPGTWRFMATVCVAIAPPAVTPAPVATHTFASYASLVH